MSGESTFWKTKRFSRSSPKVCAAYAFKSALDRSEAGTPAGARARGTHFSSSTALPGAGRAQMASKSASAPL